MLFWKMFFIASFTHGHMRVTMLGAILMFLMSPAIGLIALFFHIIIHAYHIYSAKVEMSSKRFRHLCYNRDPERFDEYDYPED